MGRVSQAAREAGGRAISADGGGGGRVDSPADAGTAAAVDELRGALALLMGAERRLKGRLAKAGVNVSHAHVRALFLLLHEGEATAGALARATDLNPASVTALIDQLEQRGLLRRRRHERDRRVCLVSLTAVGRAQIREQERAWVERLHEVFAGTPVDDLRTASRVLGHLTTVMEGTLCGLADGGGPSQDQPRRRPPQALKDAGVPPAG